MYSVKTIKTMSEKEKHHTNKQQAKREKRKKS